MAINSQNSRRSVLGTGLPSNIVPPLPKGVIRDNNTDGSDLKEVAGYYRSNFTSSPVSQLITALINLAGAGDFVARSASLKTILEIITGESTLISNYISTKFFPQFLTGESFVKIGVANSKKVLFSSLLASSESTIVFAATSDKFAGNLFLGSVANISSNFNSNKSILGEINGESVLVINNSRKVSNYANFNFGAESSILFVPQVAIAGKILDQIGIGGEFTLLTLPNSRIIYQPTNVLVGTGDLSLKSIANKVLDLKLSNESQILAGFTNRLISYFSSIGTESNIVLGSPLVEQIIVATATLTGVGEIVAIIPSAIIPIGHYSKLGIQLYLQRTLNVPVYINRVQTFTLYRTS